MMGRRKMVQLGVAAVLSLVLVGPIRSFAATATTNYQHAPQTDVLLTEAQTSSTTSSGEEFIELYNNTNADIDLADTMHGGKDAWKLQYFASTKLNALVMTSNWTGPSRTIALSGIIPAHDYYVLAGGAYNPGSIVPDQSYTATLADDGGALQLVDSTTTGSATTVTIHDQLAWSSDTSFAASPLFYVAPGTGKSLQRLPNNDTEYVNADGTLTTFISDANITPDGAWVAPAPVPDPTDTPGSDDTDSTSSDDGASSTPPVALNNDGLLAPVITELLPNPASPQTDEQDEYIELYNPNDVAFNLNGYTLETGQNTLHDFTFTSDTLLAPGAYTAIYSAETGLSLSNSGSQARLLAKDATLLTQTDPYTAAADGQAWALASDSSEWHWSTTPTPNAENLITVPTPSVKTTVTKVTKPKIKTASKVKGVSTTKKAKVAKAKKTTAKKVTDTKLASSTIDTPAPIHPVVLAGVAALGVGYGVYEYRQDLANKLYKFRTNRAARRRARA